MKAMVLAAGLGTRLRPITNDRPKAMVNVGGRTLLEIALDRLRSFGIQEAVVNVHHHAEMIIDYLKANNNFGMRIEISREQELLDTGGGLKKAAKFLLDSGSDAEEPFLLHNVDVISTIDLARMARFHTEHGVLATLAVQERETSRYLLFDEHDHLSGRRVAQTASVYNPDESVRSAKQVRALAFSGIHVISPRIFALMKEEGSFSIIDAYLRLAAQGEKIIAFRADEYYWRDLGRPESIVQAERDLSNGIWSLA